MLDEAEAGAGKRTAKRTCCAHRAVAFRDDAGLSSGLPRKCPATRIKAGDHPAFEATDTGRKTSSSYSGHLRADIGRLSNCSNENVFQDLPASSAIFQPMAFVFSANYALSINMRAVAACSAMAAAGALTGITIGIRRARFGSDKCKRVAARQFDAENETVLGEIKQWDANFADMTPYPINTVGHVARVVSTRMDVHELPWCARGRAPHVENIEKAFPMLIPFCFRWKDSDSRGHGKCRSRATKAQSWVTRPTPIQLETTTASNSVWQTPQPLFGGYSRSTVPGLAAEVIKTQEAMDSAEVGTLDLKVLAKSRSGDACVSQPYGGSMRRAMNGRTKTGGLSAGSAGYCDLTAVQLDAAENLAPAEIASDVSGMVVYQACGHTDIEDTATARAAITVARCDRRCPHDELEASLPERKPAAEILDFFWELGRCDTGCSLDAGLISGDAEISLSTTYNFARIHQSPFPGLNQQCHRSPLAALVPFAVPRIRRGSPVTDGHLPQSADSGEFRNWVLATKGKGI